MKKQLLLLSLALLSMGSQAVCPSVPTADRFELHGDEVIDRRTGLVWQRCMVGQTWNGSTCAGTYGWHTYDVAMGLAKQANATDSPAGWRVPNIKELFSLVDLGCADPAIDSVAFPATPGLAIWSATPEAVRAAYGSNTVWWVHMRDGRVTAATSPGSTGKALRLVRSAR